uniref:Breast cancer anti-estrogen resistance protein 1 n=1 Tax=Callorhinchus milii TaxID=7868 RepID=V9KB14_CALMI
MKHKNLMAKALYDNAPESPEELSFRKGEVLMVIEQNTGGLEGWWLCSLHGRQGIAPGNRLKLLVGPLYDGSLTPPTQLAPAHLSLQQGIYQVPPSALDSLASGDSYRDPVYQVPPSHQNQSIYQVPPTASGHAMQGHETYQVPPSVHRSPWGVDSAYHPNKVVTPIRCGQGYIYDSPSKQQQGIYDIPPVHQQGLYDLPPSMSKGLMNQKHARERRAQGVYDIPSGLGKEHREVYDIPPTACKEANYDFPPPLRQATDSQKHYKSEGLYDIPPPAAKSASPLQSAHTRVGLSSPNRSIYDVPPTAVNTMSSTKRQGIYDIPPVYQQTSQKDVYDIPRGLLDSGQNAGTEMSKPAVGNGIYDVPPQVSQDVKGMLDVTDGMNRLSFSSTGSTRSNMSTSSTTSKESTLSASPLPEKKLLLDVDSAFEKLTCLQHGVESSISALMAFVVPDWRSHELREKHVSEIHASADKVKQSLSGFIGFAQGATANASGLSDTVLHNKLRKQLQRLDDSYQILMQTSQALDSKNWALNMLGINKLHNKCDDLDRFVMVTKTVPDDVKQLASSISANAEYLFKQGIGIMNLETVHETTTANIGGDSRTNRNHTNSHGGKTLIKIQPLLHTPSQLDHEAHISSKETVDKSWMEDYDYVHLQGKDEFERQQKELLEKGNIVKQNKIQLEQHQLNQFQELEKEVIKPVENDLSNWNAPKHIPHDSSSLSVHDKQLLFFYSEQCETHFVTLLNAIDAFFNSISAGQPPRIFVAHSKFIILSAHKLVFIGDTLSRQAMAQDIRNKVLNYSNLLCELLKNIVTATKVAALHYPHTATVQEMVDRVTELSHHAHQFRNLLLKLASL